jgi:hypothetical protein
VKAPCARATMLAVVLAGLCFSVGEGLRLLPLPHAPSNSDRGAEVRAGLSGPGALPQNQFKPGSMGLPPQPQKNLQYKQTHYAPPSGCLLPPPGHVARRQTARRSAGRDLTLSVPGPAGRAPPRTA